MSDGGLRYAERLREFDLGETSGFAQRYETGSLLGARFRKLSRHGDVIVKDRRETLYGHKVFLNIGKSGMIIDMLMERGNPADATRALPVLAIL